MFLDRDNKEEGFSINSELNDHISMTSNPHVHVKIYAPYELQSCPPQKPWICSICGKEGIDVLPMLSNDYDSVKARFNK